MVNPEIDYPFPVVKNDLSDYKSSKFITEITVTPENNGYKIDTQISINNKEITLLLEAGKASVGVYIQCDTTWLREIHRVSLGNDSFILSTQDVHHRVYICPVITANEKITAFSSDDFVDEYKGMSFIIHPGDPLAIGEVKYFDADYEDDILRKGDPIISVDSNPTVKDMYFGLESDVLVVYVPEKVKNAFTAMKISPEKYSVLSVMFYLPAITEGVRCLAENEERYVAYEWGKTMRQSIMNLAAGDEDKYTAMLDNPFQTAQKLLGGMDKAALDLASWSVTIV